MPGSHCSECLHPAESAIRTSILVEGPVTHIVKTNALEKRDVV